jgi:hypothetical protein
VQGNHSLIVKEVNQRQGKRDQECVKEDDRQEHLRFGQTAIYPQKEDLNQYRSESEARIENPPRHG